jgi:subtilisin-like proprotein convertase family protein
MRATVILLLGLVHFNVQKTHAQITFNGQGGLPVPPGAPSQTIGITQSTNTVTGIGVLGGCSVIESVNLNMTHTFVGDVGILLIGPGGQVLDLSTGNGSGGDNFTNTVFSDNAPLFITQGTPPYTGTFRPEGRATSINFPYSNANPLGTFTFANTFNGTNADGVWTLYINDFLAADIGVLISWSITFGTGSGNITANAGPNRTICEGGTTTLTASGGDTYLWSDGSTTSTISVSPTATTTYTVTVTVANCGTDTDDAVVTVNPRPTLTLSVVNTPDVCAGNCINILATANGFNSYSGTLRLTQGATVLSTVPFSFVGATATIAICPPPNTPAGPFDVQILTLTNGSCSCP